MTKIIIHWNNTLYEGYEDVEDADLAQTILLKEIEENGYYMLKTVKGIDIMFPYNALLNATVKLVELKEKEA